MSLFTWFIEDFYSSVIINYYKAKNSGALSLKHTFLFFVPHKVHPSVLKLSWIIFPCTSCRVLCVYYLSHALTSFVWLQLFWLFALVGNLSVTSWQKHLMFAHSETLWKQSSGFRKLKTWNLYIPIKHLLKFFHYSETFSLDFVQNFFPHYKETVLIFVVHFIGKRTSLLNDTFPVNKRSAEA